MAKKSKEEIQETEGKQGRRVVITDSNGEQHYRNEVIKDLYFNQGWKRSEIRKHLADEYGHEVPYQIVYAATKTGGNTDNQDADVEEAAE